ncbi:hypothetical protein PG988_009361 [Apiospora saccharicola]
MRAITTAATSGDSVHATERDIGAAMDTCNAEVRQLVTLRSSLEGLQTEDEQIPRLLSISRRKFADPGLWPVAVLTPVVRPVTINWLVWPQTVDAESDRTTVTSLRQLLSGGMMMPGAKEDKAAPERRD